jgi:hypothetical protein
VADNTNQASIETIIIAIGEETILPLQATAAHHLHLTLPPHQILVRKDKEAEINIAMLI